MSTKRRPIQRGLRAHISAEVLSLYGHLRTIRNDRAQRAEYVAGEKRLCRLLGLDYWSMLNPLSVDCPERATRKVPVRQRRGAQHGNGGRRWMRRWNARRTQTEKRKPHERVMG